MREFKIGDKFKHIERDLTYEVTDIVRYRSGEIAHYELMRDGCEIPALAYYNDVTFLDGTFNLFNSNIWEYIDDGNFWEVE